MLSNTLSGRLIIIGFMILVGFSFAKSLYVGSTMGIILAITSLVAGVYFIYLMLNLRPSKQHQEDDPQSY